ANTPRIVLEGATEHNLRDVTVEIPLQRLVCVTGVSGSGKSTLLQALERGVYSHVPGDGRERVVTLPSAMSVRAEDGRAVSHTD
ncbi:ABC-ATPase domain-containing protein, partial [Mycobacterium tuberculosis]|nr:ABC-ATPase domain-containing protein [Mycobacterium tuberculosis]